MFSSEFFYGLVILGLSWTGLGALALVVLLIRDWIRKELW